MTADKPLPLGTMIDAITIVSACTCSSLVAEYISGSEAEFAKLMNETAARMGINAYFEDASGLSDNNLITPRGVAQLVHKFITKYPDILKYTSKASAEIDGKLYYSTNWFLPIKDTKFYYEGVDGFKTGTTNKAGKCIAATAKKGSERVITVVMKSPTYNSRYTDSTALLDDAFYKANYIAGNMFTTDIRAYVNGNEIPCYYKKRGVNEVCITAEELRFYGFDTWYDETTSTLYIAENSEKEKSPLICEKTEAEVVHKIYEHPDLKAVLLKDGEMFALKTAVSLGGQCAISIDELGLYYTKTWDNDTRKVEIITK